MAMVSMESPSNWALLPELILDSILEKLVELSHYVRFSSVCKPWHSVALHQKHNRILTHHKQIPLLLIPTKDRSHKRRSLYSITQNKIFNLQLHVPYDRRFCGSSHGWLAAVEESLGITLMNPFSGKTICLPPAKRPNARYTKRDPYEYQVQKVILSVDPSIHPNDYVVVAIYSEYNNLAFIRSGDKVWTYIDRGYSLFKDVIFCEGQIYALEYYGAVLSVEVTGIGYQLKKIVPETLEHPSKSYIVESSHGNLLLVRRYLKPLDNERSYVTQDVTKKFEVLWLQHPSGQDGQPEWVVIESLGDDALFVGDNHSLAVLASDFPGCQPNCIYYTDDYFPCAPYFPDGPCDMGIYNLDDGSYGLHYKLKPKLKRMPPPLWIVPSLK